MCTLSLVEKRLEHDDLVSWIYKPHKGTEHAFICPTGNGNFSIRVNISTEEGRIGFGDCLLQSRPALNHSLNKSIPFSEPSSNGYLRWSILITVHVIQRVFGCTDDKLGRIVTAGSSQHELSEKRSQLGKHTHKNPWPIFIIGCIGDAAAPSLTMVLITSEQPK